MARTMFNKLGYIASATASFAVNQLLPERCALCMTPDQCGFCANCQQLLPAIQVACQHCATPIAMPGVCGQCQNKASSFEHAIAPFAYQPPISMHIQQLKYHSRLDLAPALAKMLITRVLKCSDVMPELLVPVPLHERRLFQRGFNQAALIASVVGNLLDIPVQQKLVRRVRDTISQTSLDRASRIKNVRDAFAVIGQQRYDSVAIIDDVMTSGATVEALAKSLRASGYAKISVWSIAKT